MRSARASSSSAVRLLAVVGLAGSALALALTRGDEVLPGIVGVAIAGPAAVLLIADVLRGERRRHEAIQRELAAEAATLEALLASFGTIASTLDPHAIPDVVRREAERLFGGRAELVSGPDGASDGGGLVVPLRLGDDERVLVRVTADGAPTRAGAARARMLGDFATRVHESARLRVEAQAREAERARLSDQLATAEQGERRRLALHLHDTSVQALSGIALMLDAVRQALDAGRADEARTILDAALARLRDAIRGLRELSFALEPLVLRDQGFGPAVAALAEQLGREGGIRFQLDVAAAEALDENAKSALYQIVREALHAAIRRGPPGHVSIRVGETADGFEAVIADDAPGERRRASFEGLVERARAVSGRVAIESGDGPGTTVRVQLPAYAAR